MAISRASGSECYCVQFGDGATFLIAENHSEILVRGPSEVSDDDIGIYLAGPICGLLLYLRGSTCLHASAIAHEGKALAFVGGAEAGKSTLAGQFARLGCRVLTDDVLQLRETDDGASAIPGVPRIGLWAPSVAHLWGDEEALPKQVPTWEKRYFNLLAANLFQETELPLAAIYVLADRKPNAALFIDTLQDRTAVFALIANKYVTRVSKPEQDIRDFLFLSKLAASIPIRRIARRDALSDLRHTCEAILSDYANCASAAA